MLWTDIAVMHSKIQINFGEESIIISKNTFIEIIRRTLAYVDVDEAWYLSNYTDVKAAVESRIVPSAKDHFVMYGYFENKLPYEVEVDEKFYLEKYDDVKIAIERGDFLNAKEHYLKYGAVEGRKPYEKFSIF